MKLMLDLNVERNHCYFTAKYMSKLKLKKNSHVAVDICRSLYIEASAEITWDHKKNKSLSNACSMTRDFCPRIFRVGVVYTSNRTNNN